MIQLSPTLFPEGSPARSYPYLAYLLAGWFHQDYSYSGSDLDEMIAEYRKTASETERIETIGDIQRFISNYDQDQRLISNAFETIFQPGVTIEGWDGLTTSEWLERVRKLLLESA